MNTIASRIAKNGEALEVYGVSINDTEGNLRSTYDILNDLSKEWVNMSNAEKIALGTQLSGVNQYKVFSAIMTNFSKAQESLNEQLSITGTTAKQNAIYMESLEAKVQLLKAEFEKLVLGDGGLQKFAKLMVDLATNTLKFLNSGIGQVIVSITTTIALMTALKAIMDKTKFGNYVKGILSANSATELWNASLLKLIAEWALTPFGMATIVIASIVGIAVAIEKLYGNIDKINEKLVELQDASDMAQTELESLEEQLKNVQNRIKEINDLGGIEIGASDKELKILQEEEKTLKRQVALQKYKAEIAKKALEKEARTDLNKTVRLKTRKTSVSSVDSTVFGRPTQYTLTDGMYNFYGTPKEVLEKTISLYTEYNSELEKYKQKMDACLDSEGNLIKGREAEFNQYEQIVQAYEDNINNLNSGSSSLIDMVQNIVDVLGDKELGGLIDKFFTLVGVTDDVNDSVSDNNELTEEEIEYQQELADSVQKLIDELSLEKTTLDKLKQSFESIDKVMEEINSQNGLSVEAYEELMSMGSNYINALFDENGNLRSNLELRKDLYKIKIQEMALNEADKLVTLAEQYNEQKKSLTELNKVLTSNNDLTWENLSIRLEALELQGQDTTAIRKRIYQMRSWAYEAEKNIDTMTKSTNAIKDEKDALKDLKSQYDDAITFIKKKYDDYVDKLKDEEDVVIDSIEKQIKAIKDKKEAEIDAIDKQIHALEKENDEREKSIKLQEKLEALAKAKSKKVKVYKEGQGFVYDTDQEAVAKAQKDLNDYLYENDSKGRIDSLKEQKDILSEEYDKQLKLLEDSKQTTKDNYEEQIKIYKNYKDQFEGMVSSYTDNQSKLLVQQLTGIDLENKNWMTRLDNLKNFAEEYNSILKDLDRIENTEEEEKSAYSVVDASGKTIKDFSDLGKAREFVRNSLLNGSNSASYKVVASGEELVGTFNPNTKLMPNYINEQALLREQQRQNAFAEMDKTIEKNRQQTNNIVNISNLSLPNVTNAEQFLKELSLNFTNDMNQLAFSN